MTPMTLISTILFSLAMMGLALHRKHLVSALLCLEGLMLALFLSLSFISQVQQLSTTATQPIMLLAFAACEASTGLALLVASSRTHASNNLKTLNLLKC